MVNDECSMGKGAQVDTAEREDTDPLVIAGIEFKSRLWVGTGKYKDFVETKQAIEASGEMPEPIHLKAKIFLAEPPNGE